MRTTSCLPCDNPERGSETIPAPRWLWSIWPPHTAAPRWKRWIISLGDQFCIARIHQTHLLLSQFRVCILRRPHLKANYVITPREGCHNLKAPPNAAHLFPLFGGCTITILRGLTYPKILCVPEKEERKRENGDIAWRRSSLSQAWAAEIMT